jgi:GNAT superfamily N-acetyltransferase
MEIRTLRQNEREQLLDLLDGWGLPDGWAGRDFFRRYMDLDPTYTDENVWVAHQDGELLSCVQIFPRSIRVLGHVVPTGGIGSVFTRVDRRGEGLAGGLLEAAALAMRRRGMEVSLLFTGRLSFYEQHGWGSWKMQRAVVRRSPRPPGTAQGRVIGAAGDLDSAGACDIAAFDRERDLADVRALHAHYSSGRNGTVVRDDELWRASFLLAGNPDEQIRVVRRGDRVIAYLRVTRLEERRIVTELARIDENPDALAALVDDALEPRTGTQGGGPSPDGRSSGLLLPAFDDLQFTLALEQAGIASQPVDDPSNMLRCLDGPALSRRLGAPMAEAETDQAFLLRALPADEFVFWPADRF